MRTKECEREWRFAAVTVVSWKCTADGVIDTKKKTVRVGHRGQREGMEGRLVSVVQSRRGGCKNDWEIGDSG